MEEKISESFEIGLQGIEKELKKSLNKSKNTKEMNVIFLAGIYEQLNIANKVKLFNLKKEGK